MENKIDLNAPVANYGVNLNKDGIVRVIHLLTHTSEGVSGSRYKYNGDRYTLLSNVIQSATGNSFHRLATERITLPLRLQSSAPGDLTLAALNGLIQ